MRDKEYIERGALVEHIKNMPWKITPAAEISKGIFLQTVEDAPAADVVEVRHGEWIHHETEDEDWGGTYHKWTCSCCGYSTGDNPCEANYCPNCGAKMDGERKERT